MIPALWAFSVVVTVLAWIVARHRPEHRPIAWLLGYGLATDAVREIIGARVLRPARVELAGAPFTGWVRVAFHLESALFVGWMAGVAALAVWIFGRRRPWGVLIAWAVAVAVLAIGYPALRGALLAKVYTACELAALCVSVGFLLRWYFGREPAQSHHFVGGLIVVAELTMLAGPYRVGIFGAWDLARSILFALYLALTPTQGVLAWRRTS
ncbi:hypothetical protein WMF27_20895 [Sorangium sp. So ce281]|uniref:hypothetical protein n=1 Tax=unclassified Sorangium TaxID=2621164 RepID=UPI003F5EAAF1